MKKSLRWLTSHFRIWPVAVAILVIVQLLLDDQFNSGFDSILTGTSFIAGIFFFVGSRRLYFSQREFRDSMFGPAISSLICSAVFLAGSTILIIYITKEIDQEFAFFIAFGSGLLCPRWKIKGETYPQSRASQQQGSRSNPAELNQTPADPIKIDDHVFHLAVYTPPPHESIPEDNANNMLITAEVIETRFDDGSLEWTNKFFADHDPLTLVEVSAAIFWRDYLISNEITPNKLLESLKWLQEATDSKYEVEGFTHRSKNDDITLYALLCTASIHTFIAFLHSETSYREAAIWFHNENERLGNQFRWNTLVSPAQRLRKAIENKAVRKDFAELLLKSVGVIPPS